MAGLIRADPARLEAYSEDTAPALARACDAVEAYREALTAFNAAEPNDLGSHLTDRSATIIAALQGLAALDELPAAFAAALRQLDTAYDPAAPRAQVLTAEDPLAFYGAAAAHLLLDRLPPLRDIGRWLDQERNRLGKLGEWFADLPEAVELVLEDVTTVVRRTVIIVEEATENAWRRAILTADELQHVVRRWSVSIDLAEIRRAAPYLKKLGAFGDAATGAFAAWDQWDTDATRPDLTSTERALRAAADGFGRGATQAGISGISGAVAAPFVMAAPVTAGLSLIPAGAVIAAGVWAGEKADPWLGGLLDDAYEFGPVSRAIQTGANELDDAGRGIRDAAVNTVQLTSEVWTDANTWMDEQWPQ